MNPFIMDNPQSQTQLPAKRPRVWMLKKSSIRRGGEQPTETQEVIVFTPESIQRPPWLQCRHLQVHPWYRAFPCVHQQWLWSCPTCMGITWWHILSPLLSNLSPQDQRLWWQSRQHDGQVQGQKPSIVHVLLTWAISQNSDLGVISYKRKWMGWVDLLQRWLHEAHLA